MALDHVDPRFQPTSVEESRAWRNANIERRLGALERGSFNTVARGRLYTEAADEINTPDVGPHDLGGPTIEVTVGEGRFISVFVEVEMKVDAGGPAAVYLADSLDGTDGDPILITNAADWTRMRTAATGIAGTTGFLGQTRVYPATPGEHQIRLLYSQGLGGSALAYFRNRKLWVEVV